jgi:hypothetical protein
VAGRSQRFAQQRGALVGLVDDQDPHRGAKRC